MVHKINGTRPPPGPGLGWRSSRWSEVDYFAPRWSRVTNLLRRTPILTFTIVPAWVPPRRYRLRWQLLQWVGAAVCLIVALIF